MTENCCCFAVRSLARSLPLAERVTVASVQGSRCAAPTHFRTHTQTHTRRDTHTREGRIFQKGGRGHTEVLQAWRGGGGRGGLVCWCAALLVCLLLTQTPTSGRCAWQPGPSFSSTAAIPPPSSPSAQVHVADLHSIGKRMDGPRKVL